MIINVPVAKVIRYTPSKIPSDEIRRQGRHTSDYQDTLFPNRFRQPGEVTFHHREHQPTKGQQPQQTAPFHNVQVHIMGVDIDVRRRDRYAAHEQASVGIRAQTPKGRLQETLPGRIPNVASG